MKKRRRYFKKKNRARKSTMMDCHHLCWSRRDWSYGGYAKLRRHPYCIVWINKLTLHKYIHERMDPIPMPKEGSATAIVEKLNALEELGVINMLDPIEKRLAILASLFDYGDPLTANAFRKQLQLVREFTTKAPR